MTCSFLISPIARRKEAMKRRGTGSGPILLEIYKRLMEEQPNPAGGSMRRKSQRKAGKVHAESFHTANRKGRLIKV